METWARDLVFSPKQLSLAALRASHPPLPVLVKVLGDTSHTGGLCPEQILVFHMWINQERVIGRNHRGDTISIPVNCTQQFKVLGAHTTEAATPAAGLLIPSILKAHQLPVKVEAECGDHGAGSCQGNGSDVSHGAGACQDNGATVCGDNGSTFTWDSFGKVTLVSTHKITYGLASVLTTGEAQVCQLFPVPVCRPVQLQVVTKLNVLQAAFLEDHTEQITELLTSVSHHAAGAGHQVRSLPSIAVTDYGLLLSGETVLAAACGKGPRVQQPTQAAAPSAHSRQGEEEPANSTAEPKHDTLLAAVDRFTHYQHLLSSSSPKTKRRAGDNMGKQTPPQHGDVLGDNTGKQPAPQHGDVPGENRGKHQSPQHGDALAADKAGPSRQQSGSASSSKPSQSKHKFGPASLSPVATSAGCSLREGILMMHQSLGVELKDGARPLSALNVNQPKASGKDTEDYDCVTEL